MMDIKAKRKMTEGLAQIFASIRDAIIAGRMPVFRIEVQTINTTKPTDHWESHKPNGMKRLTVVWDSTGDVTAGRLPHGEWPAPFDNA